MSRLSSDWSSFLCLRASAPFGERRVWEFDSTAVTRNHLNCDRSLLSTVKSEETGRRPVFNQEDYLLATGQWEREAPLCCCASDLHLAPETLPTRARVGTDKTEASSEYDVCGAPRRILSLTLGGCVRHLKRGPTWISCEKYTHFNSGSVKVEASPCLSHYFRSFQC